MSPKIKTEEPPVSAFERKRLENIAANRALLNDLSTTAAKIALKPKPAPKPRTSSTRSRLTGTPMKKEPARPTRTSSRIKGIEADSEVAKRKAEEEAELAVAGERLKRKRISGDLKLQDIKVEGVRWNQGDEVFTPIETKRGAHPYLRTFTENDIKETSDDELKNLRKIMSGLELLDTWSPPDIKITPERIYSMGFHPRADKPYIFAGDKVGNLGIFDASQKPEIDDEDEADLPKITVMKMHTKTISSLLFPVDKDYHVYTASYDSSIRSFDLNKAITTELWAPQDTDDEEGISALEQPSTDSNLLYFSRLDGTFGRVDIRDPIKSQKIWQLQGKKIGGFSLHPLNPHLFATASLDRTLKIWDLRKPSQTDSNAEPQLLYEHESRLSVSHAAWNAAGQISTSSYDDTIKIHNFPSAKEWEIGHHLEKEDVKPAVTIKHNNQTGRWVTILKPQWQQRPEDGIQKFVIGNMNRFVDVYSGMGEQLAQLGGDGISAVPAVAQFHPSKNWVVGGTASGKLCLWH